MALSSWRWSSERRVGLQPKDAPDYRQIFAFLFLWRSHDGFGFFK